jgi:CPA2 family monovalent cation:H+ antiporter-2
VVATPDGFQTRRIVELSRELVPGIELVVRTHSADPEGT